MSSINVSIIEYVDDSQSGFVRCHFKDVFQKDCFFVDKVSIVTSEYLDESSQYPQPGMIEVTVQKIFAENNIEFAIINIDSPWCISSEDNETVFTVLKSEVFDFKSLRS